MKEHELQLTDEAVEDVQEIFDWYEKQLKGLGERFMQSLDQGFQKIEIAPFSFAHTGFFDFRRHVLKTFPYKVFYLLQKESIVIVAIVHKSGLTNIGRVSLEKEELS